MKRVRERFHLAPALPAELPTQNIQQTQKTQSREVLRPAHADRFDRDGGQLIPRFSDAALEGITRPAHVMLPERATDPFVVTDAISDMTMHIALVGAVEVHAEQADGYVVYRGADPSGADLIHRATPEGTEDFIVFETEPEASAAPPAQTPPNAPAASASTASAGPKAPVDRVRRRARARTASGGITHRRRTMAAVCRIAGEPQQDNSPAWLALLGLGLVFARRRRPTGSPAVRAPRATSPDPAA